MLFLYGGLLYLFGIAIILLLKPVFMFTASGQWKEFGIGRSREKYTWFPFWLFAVLWGIVSYTAVLCVYSAFFRNQFIYSVQSINNTMNIPKNQNKKQNRKLKISNINSSSNSINNLTLKPGYYALNAQSNSEIPKYIYIGPQSPQTPE